MLRGLRKIVPKFKFKKEPKQFKFKRVDAKRIKSKDLMVAQSIFRSEKEEGPYEGEEKALRARPSAVIIQRENLKLNPDILNIEDINACVHTHIRDARRDHACEQTHVGTYARMRGHVSDWLSDRKDDAGNLSTRDLDINGLNGKSKKGPKCVRVDEIYVLHKRKKRESEKVRKPKIKLAHRKKMDLEEAEAHKEFFLAEGMAIAYERKLREYSGNSHVRYLKEGRLEKNSTNYQAFVRSSKLCQEVGCTQKEFVEAQFYWFHEWFRRGARPYELCAMNNNFNSIKRAKTYLEIKRKKGLTARNEVVRNGMTVKVPVSTYVRYGEKLMEDLIRLHKISEEEILRKFGRPDLGYFDLRYLETNPTWIQLHRDGEI